MIFRIRFLAAVAALVASVVSASAQSIPASEDPFSREDPFAAGSTLWSIASLHRDTVFAAGDAATVRRTYDGGTSWTVFDSVAHSSPVLLGITALSATDLWAAGQFGSVLHSADTAAHWSLTTLDSSKSFFAVCFSTPENGIVVGDNRTIYRTSDAGATWRKTDSAGTLPLLGAAFANPARGWVVGGGGTILTTTDGGETWSPQTSGVTNFLYAVACTAPGTVVIAGTQGTILRTTDDGASWTKQVTGTTKYYYGISFCDSANGLAVGNSGLFQRTTDGGSSWAQVAGVPPINYYCVTYRDTAHWVAAGANGTIVSRIDTSLLVTGVRSAIGREPVVMKLAQNYPNPFNPSTTIEFTLAGMGDVSMTVYDLLGRTVASLASGAFERGTHRETWNGAGKASGIYFYRLDVTDRATGKRWSETKKMLLIR